MTEYLVYIWSECGKPGFICCVWAEDAEVATVLAMQRHPGFDNYEPAV